MTEPHIAVVVPVRDEKANIEPLVVEIEAVLRHGAPFEVIYVDDGSTDGSGDELLRLEASRPWLRHRTHERPCGQTAAVRTGVQAARAPVVVTLDGDGQNNPAYIPRLVHELAEAGPGCGLVQGERLGRSDPGMKRLRSTIANSIRRAVLDDGTRDTCCGLKCFPRAVYLNLPYFDTLHRFMPAIVHGDGYSISLINVIDRPRFSGSSHYRLFDHLWSGILDLFGVLWLIRRRRRMPATIEEDLASAVRTP